MEHSNWDARWSAGRIGFHLGKPHALLERHLGLFASAGSVLVPLAGKTADLDLLSTVVPAVIANEFVEAAPRAYFAEREVVPTEHREHGVLQLAHAQVTFLVHDFFALVRSVAGGYDTFFDRAALVAILPSDRERYAATLARLTHAGSVGLLITLEYDPQQMEGPPFSVFASDVTRLFAKDFEIGELAATDEPSGIRMDVVGGMQVRERAWRLQRR